MKINELNEWMRLEIQIRNIGLFVNSSKLDLTIWTDQGGVEERHSLFTQDEIRERATKKLKTLEQEKSKKIEPLTVAEKQALVQFLGNDITIKTNSFI